MAKKTATTIPPVRAWGVVSTTKDGTPYLLNGGAGIYHRYDRDEPRNLAKELGEKNDLLKYRVVAIEIRVIEKRKMK